MATSSQYGAFVQTTNIWGDMQRVESADVNSPEFKELIVRLYQNVNLIANVLNIKDTGQYPLMEVVCNQLYFPNPANSSSTPAYPAERQVLRKTFNVAGGAPVGVTTIPHSITVTAATTFTRIYGVANDTVGNNYYPIPASSVLGGNTIEMELDATNIYITNTTVINFNIVYVVVEYMQS